MLGTLYSGRRDHIENKQGYSLLSERPLKQPADDWEVPSLIVGRKDNRVLVVRGTHIAFNTVAKPEQSKKYLSLGREIKGMWMDGVEPELVAGVQSIKASSPDPGDVLTALGRIGASRP